MEEYGLEFLWERGSWPGSLVSGLSTVTAGTLFGTRVATETGESNCEWFHLLGKGGAMLPIKAILYATDFSPPSEYAFQFACSLAQDYAAKLIVLHVMEEPKPLYGGVMTPPPPEGMSEDERKQTQLKLEGIRPTNVSIKLEHIVATGDAEPAITQIARKRNCDVIVAGTHGRTGVRRAMLGSVAESVLRNANCPVLTVRMPVAET